MLKNDQKISIDNIDSIVCAEIPDEKLHPKAYATVINCMLHNVCGDKNPNAPCMKDGNCSKKFPKDFVEKTYIASK